MSARRVVIVMLLLAVIVGALYARQVMAQAASVTPAVSAFTYKNPRGKVIHVNYWRNGQSECHTVSSDHPSDMYPVAISCVRIPP